MPYKACALILASLLLFSCVRQTIDDDSSPTPPDTLCGGFTDVACSDSVFQDLSLHDDKISSGSVTAVVDGDDWLVTVDATAGGFSQAANNPFVYVKLNESTGAERVDINDDEALLSQDWDLALRRYMVRINSGDSGPGCVLAATMGGQSYSAISSVPSASSFNEDDYYANGCAMIEDNSGLPGSPALALGAWWFYNTCLETTDIPFVLELSTGQHLKLLFEAYYGTGQDSCNSTGTPGGQSGMITFRLAFLD